MNFTMKETYEGAIYQLACAGASQKNTKVILEQKGDQSSYIHVTVEDSTVVPDVSQPKKTLCAKERITVSKSYSIDDAKMTISNGLITIEVPPAANLKELKVK